MQQFDAVAYFSERAVVYERDAFEGSGLAHVSELELSVLDRHVAVGEKVVLDVGMGTGRVSRRLRRLGAHVIGVDASLEMMSRARAQHPDAVAVQGRLGDALPFATASVDGVVAFRVLKYLQNWQPALGEIARVLRSDGWAVLEFANARSLARFGYLGLPVRCASVADVRRELAGAGLRIVAIDAGTRVPHAGWRWARTPLRARVLAGMERAAACLAPRAGARSIVVTCQRSRH